MSGIWGRVLCVLLWSACVVWGAGPVILDDRTTEVELAPHLSLYRDASGRMTLDEVRQAWAGGGFAPVTGQRPTLGFTVDAVWLRFEVRHGGAAAREWLLELMTPRMDEVRVFLLHSSGQIDHFETGKARSAQSRVLDTVDPAFPLLLQPGESVECFLRIRSETSLQLPLRLSGVGSLTPAGPGKQELVAVLFGYLISLILLGFVFGRVAREPSFLLYALALCGIFVVYLILSGYWAWLGLPGGAFVAKQGLIIAAEFALMMKMAFLRRLFDLKRVMAAVERWSKRAMVSIVFVAAALVMLPYRIAFPLCVGHLLVLGMGMMLLATLAWWRGDRVAGLYLAAWLVFWACYGMNAVFLLVRHPLPYLPWIYCLLGTNVSATLFLVAIADRVRQIRQAALEAQERLVAVERQASEELRQQICREQLLIRDLHDGIGGLTANLAILAEIGRRDAPAGQERERFARITEMATHGGAEVRSLMSLLETREMSWTDFFDECRCHGQMALEPHGIEFRLDENSAIEAAGPEIFAGLSLLRVIKEAMANAVKHAACSRVEVCGRFTTERLRLTVRDNGAGFPSSGTRGGRGLRNMADRIRELGGTMDCRSGHGVELVFELPLPLKLLVPASG